MLDLDLLQNYPKSSYFTRYEFSKLGGLFGKISFGIGVGMNIKGVINYYDDPSSPNSVHPGKAGLNTGMGLYGLYIDPLPAMLYFGVDAFYPGGWPQAFENMERLQNDNRKIVPDFELLPRNISP